MEDISQNKKKDFVSYKDDNDEKVSGYFIIRKEDKGLIIFTEKNEILIPWHRVLKVKTGVVEE